jgi:hypothetical protein
MKTNTFFTGTSYECAMNILTEGRISICPPKRVWNDYSEDYVYLISPPKAAKEYDHMEGEELKMRCIEMAASQASFAVWEMDHSRRVVFEVELDSEFCEDDPDCSFADRYCFDIDISQIKGVYVEKRNQCRKLKELIGLTKLIQNGEDRDFQDPYDRKDLIAKYNGLQYVKMAYVWNLQQRYETLMDWEADFSLFSYVPIELFAGRLKTA